MLFALFVAAAVATTTCVDQSTAYYLYKIGYDSFTLYPIGPCLQSGTLQYKYVNAQVLQYTYDENGITSVANGIGAMRRYDQFPKALFYSVAEYGF